MSNEMLTIEVNECLSCGKVTSGATLKWGSEAEELVGAETVIFTGKLRCTVKSHHPQASSLRDYA
jgi:hypothetical protein